MQQKSKLELLFFCGMLLLGIGMFIGTFFANTDVASTAQQSAVFYPRIILSGWIIAATFAVIGQIRRDDLPATGDLQWGKVVIGTGIVTAFVVAMRYLGFLGPAIAFFLVSSLFLGYRKPVPLVLCGVLFPLGLDLLFNKVLMLLLPSVSVSFGG